MRWFLAFGMMALAGLCTAGPAAAAGGTEPPKISMRTYNTPYYLLTADIDESTARETDLRMTRMFEEYRRRTASFSGDIRQKLSFSLFANSGEYSKAGGPSGSAGVFMTSGGSGRLMAYIQPNDVQTWHVVQHEGFHQFAAMTIKMGIPPWMNEGLAEYFGEALFTGDTFLPGAIPPYRLKILKKEIEEKKWKPFATMTTMTLKEWNAQMNYANYTQAWAMVHFLVHGEAGKYQKPFDQYISTMNHGSTPEQAWFAVFGKDVAAFQEKCEKWWMDLPENPAKDVYAKATVATLTSIMARAELQKREVKDFDSLVAGPFPTDVKLGRELWLPPKLVDEAVKAAPALGKWTIEKAAKGQPTKVVCVVPEVGTITGTYVLSSGRVDKVGVSVVAEGK